MKLNNSEIFEPECSFEISKLLKEIGFDVPTQSYYSGSDITYFRSEKYHTHSSIPTHYMLAPNLMVGCIWIEINFGIHIETFVDDDRTFGFYIVKFTDEGMVTQMERGFKTRTEALEMGMIKVLTNLK